MMMMMMMMMMMALMLPCKLSVISSPLSNSGGSESKSGRPDVILDRRYDVVRLGKQYCYRYCDSQLSAARSGREMADQQGAERSWDSNAVMTPASVGQHGR